jgi:hypothetical protein
MNLKSGQNNKTLRHMKNVKFEELNSYGRFVYWLKRENEPSKTNIISVNDMAEICKITTNQVNNYLEMLSEEEDNFTYTYYPEQVGEEIIEMVEFGWDIL